MEIILRATIDSLGRAGDVVKVKPGYARNFLLPRKLAYMATPGNLKVIENEKQALLKREARERGNAESLAAVLNGKELTFKRLAGEHGALFGSVTNTDIAEALAAQGIVVEKKRIGMDDHIKKLGETEVPIRLFKDLVAHVKVRVEAEEKTEN